MMSDPNPVTISDRNGHLIVTVMTSTIGPRESVEIVAAAAEAIGHGDRRWERGLILPERVGLRQRGLHGFGAGRGIDGKAKHRERECIGAKTPRTTGRRSALHSIR